MNLTMTPAPQESKGRAGDMIFKFPDGLRWASKEEIEAYLMSLTKEHLFEIIMSRFTWLWRNMD